MPDVLSYLHSKGLSIRNATQNNVHTPCVFCDEDPAARGRLYIATDPDADPPGLYMCHRCGAKGNLTTLKRHFGDRPQERELDADVRTEIMNVAAAYYHDSLAHHASVAAYLKGPERGLNADTIVSRLLGYAPMEIAVDIDTGERTVRGSRYLYAHLCGAGYRTADILATGLCMDRNGSIVDSLTGMITIPYIVAGQAVTIRGRTWPRTPTDFATWEFGPYDPPKAKYKTLAGTSTRLYNSDVTWTNAEVVLCEGELDAMVVEQAGWPAIAAPGAQSWQPEWDDYLVALKRIWLVYDRDPAGERGAEKLQVRLGAKVRRVHLSPPGVKCDPTVWFGSHSTSEFAELLVEAGKGGLLVTVHDAVAEFRSTQGSAGLRLGWSELDGLIRPGLLPAQLFVVLARTSAGKTALLLNFMHRLRMVPGQEDKRVLFLSLEQTRGEWWDRARRIHRFYFPTETESDAIAWWEHHFRMVDKNQLSVTEFTQVIDDYTYDVGFQPDLICIDYLGYWGRGFRGEAYERVSAAMHALKALAKDYRVPIVVPQQVSRAAKDGHEFGADAGRDSGSVEETADFLIGMWRPEDAIENTIAETGGAVQFKLLKSRHGGRGQALSMQWSPVSLVMVPAADRVNVTRARHECDWYRERPSEDWEDTILRHHPGSLL